MPAFAGMTLFFMETLSQKNCVTPAKAGIPFGFMAAQKEFFSKLLVLNSVESIVFKPMFEGHKPPRPKVYFLEKKPFCVFIGRLRA